MKLKTFNEHFTIGKKILPNVNPTNKYKLVISNMSGDADAYHETETLFDKDDEDVLKDIIDLCKWSQKGWPSRDKIQNKYDDLKEKHTKFFGGDDSDYDEEDFHDEDSEPIITRDVTSDGQYICRPEVVGLTWFDENGQEYYVKY